jgi:hypothetical protein
MSLTLELQWIPVSPFDLDESQSRFSANALFRARSWEQDSELKKQYEFNFPRLSVMTPDLHFYKLVRVLNTPLKSIKSANEAFHHLWFFRAAIQDRIVLAEYSPEGEFFLSYKDHPVDDVLRQAYERICALVNTAEKEDIRSAAQYTGPRW